MFAKVHPPGDVKSGNKASCHDLTRYLEKEAGEGKRFFSHTANSVTSEEVIMSIDNNVRALGREDAKFYMLSLDPSEAEQRHLIGKDIRNLTELTGEEQQAVFDKLKAFTRSAMNDYAVNFNRKNIQSGADLMYFARVETQRTYKFTDEAVKAGTAKIGDVKPGLNLHVHIVVSRKSLDGKTKLSPAAKSAGNTWELEGRGTVQRGFSHEGWKVQVQETFNKQFSYQSLQGEYYQVKQVPEHGILGKVTNHDLKDLLTNHRFTAANQIVAAMKERGYEHRVSKGVHTFNLNGEVVQISHKDLKSFEKPLNDVQMKDIVSRFDLAKFENAGAHYNENGLQVKDISFHTVKPDADGRNTLQSVSYKVLYDTQTKTTVSLSSVRQFAFNNHIEMVKSDLNKDVITGKMKNADLKDLLTNHRFTAANQIVAAMKERGYKHRVSKGAHIFTRGKERISILSKDLNKFTGKANADVLQSVAERFNSYKFKVEQSRYAENGLSVKTIRHYTYVKEPIYTDTADGRKQAYRTVLKSVEYNVIYDSQTKTTIPVYVIKDYAYKHRIDMFNRFQHSYAVTNPHLRECLQNPALSTIRDINAEMKKKGYTVTTDREGHYIYGHKDSSFRFEKRDLLTFTHYAKNERAERSTSAGSKQAAATGQAVAGMAGGKVQNKLMNEILGDAYRTERQLAGNVKTVVNLVKNPASIKMQLIRKIGSFLNPFSEL